MNKRESTWIDWMLGVYLVARALLQQYFYDFICGSKKKQYELV